MPELFQNGNFHRYSSPLAGLQVRAVNDLDGYFAACQLADTRTNASICASAKVVPKFIIADHKAVLRHPHCR